MLKSILGFTVANFIERNCAKKKEKKSRKSDEGESAIKIQQWWIEANLNLPQPDAARIAHSL